MKVYHYTTIENLALILKNRTIRLNRLDKVDDLEENAISNGVNLGQYIFVSCWTEDPEESIPLWKMYAGINNGVRIGLDVEMFQTYLLHDLTTEYYPRCEGSILSYIPQDDYKSPDFLITPLYSISDFYRKVEYVDNVNKYVDDAFKLVKEGTEVKNFNVEYNKIGRYKNKRWSFQKESRFVIGVFPFNLYYLKEEEMEATFINSYKDNKTLPFSFYDMHLKEDVINNIEITLSPGATESQSIIIGSLCNQYAQGARIKDSALSGKVKLK